MSTVAAIIVAYGKPDSLLNSIASIEAQSMTCDAIYVIDNTPNDSVQQALACSAHPLVRYTRFEENLGAEGGFAEGIRQAYASFDFLWLFDDDSYVEPDALKELMGEYSSLSTSVSVGALRCARPWDQPDPNGANVREILDLYAWKGSLICSAAVGKVGLPLGELFLYGGDCEYGLRLRKHAYRIYMVLSSRIHSLEYTDMQPLRLGGINKKIYNSPVRVYYACRNEWYVHLRHKVCARIFRLAALCVYNTVMCLIVKRPDLSQAVVMGFFDGVRGKLGKSERYTPSPD